MQTLFGGGSSGSSSSGPTQDEIAARQKLKAEQAAEEDRQKQESFARTQGLRGKTSLFSDFNTGKQTPVKLGV